MKRRYMDAMALVQKYGKPNFFLTVTCNPHWEEIIRELEPGQTAQDRPDISRPSLFVSPPESESHIPDVSRPSNQSYDRFTGSERESDSRLPRDSPPRSRPLAPDTMAARVF